MDHTAPAILELGLLLFLAALAGWGARSPEAARGRRRIAQKKIVLGLQSHEQPRKQERRDRCEDEERRRWRSPPSSPAW